MNGEPNITLGQHPLEGYFVGASVSFAMKDGKLWMLRPGWFTKGCYVLVLILNLRSFSWNGFSPINWGLLQN